MLAEIKPTHEESELFELILALSEAVSETLEEMGIRHAMKGGSALKIALRLGRPSTDIDFEISEGCNPEEVIRSAFDKLPGWEEASTPRQLSMGIAISTPIDAKRTGSQNIISTKLDLVPTGRFDTSDRPIRMEDTIMVQGIRVWKFEQLAERKLRTLVGKQTREEARDVYDAAFLMESHPHAISEETWLKLERWHQSIVENAHARQAWSERFPASCITFLSEQAFAPQNTRYWSRRRPWFQFTVGEDKPPMLSVDNRGKGVLSMDCSAKRSPL